MPALGSVEVQIARTQVSIFSSGSGQDAAAEEGFANREAFRSKQSPGSSGVKSSQKGGGCSDEFARP